MGQPQPSEETKSGASAASARGTTGATGLDTDLARGLTSAEAAKRLAEFGPNALAEKRTTLLQRLVRYFWGPIPWMIEAAAILSLILSNWNDFAIITLMLLINAGVSYWQEAKAEDAIKVLKKQLAPLARVLRDGTWSTIAARELVPGDVVALKIGDVTPADLKLVSGDYLSTDEFGVDGRIAPRRQEDRGSGLFRLDREARRDGRHRHRDGHRRPISGARRSSWRRPRRAPTSSARCCVSATFSS